MKALPVEVAGPSYKDRSPQLSSQRTQNMYLGPGRENKWAAYDFYGCKPFLARAGQDRGLYVFQDQLYQVSGGSLLRIAGDNSVTVLGLVSGSNRCIFDDDGLNLVIATGETVFQYNGSTVVPITSTNLETPVSVNYLNGFFLYDGDEGRFQASDAGDPATINDLSVGVANSDGDGILRGIVHDQLVYWYGSRSIEPWYFSGSGDLPFERLEQGIIQQGLGATYSLAQDKDAMYCLGADRQFYKISRSVAQPISTPAVRAVESFAVISDAIGWTLTLENQQFYWVNFPTESRSFLYSITLNYWVDLSYGMSGARHLANSYAYCYGKHLVADYRSGNLYELDRNTFTDNSQPRLRWRDMAPVTGTDIGLPGHQVTSGGLQLLMEVGVGLTAGQGADPVLMCSTSGDGGKVFQSETHVPMGIMGDYRKNPVYDHFVTGYSIVHRIGCSDPVYLSLFGGLGSFTDGGY